MSAPVLIVTIGHDLYLIPGATATDAGKLLSLFGKSIPVERTFNSERGDYDFEPRESEKYPGYYAANPKVEMVPRSSIRMPKPKVPADDATRARRAKPVQAIGGSPVLRLEGGTR